MHIQHYFVSHVYTKLLEAIIFFGKHDFSTTFSYYLRSYFAVNARRILRINLDNLNTKTMKQGRQNVLIPVGLSSYSMSLPSAGSF